MEAGNMKMLKMLNMMDMLMRVVSHQFYQSNTSSGLICDSTYAGDRHFFKRITIGGPFPVIIQPENSAPPPIGNARPGGQQQSWGYAGSGGPQQPWGFAGLVDPQQPWGYAGPVGQHQS
jgi:hypothetical protein